MPSTNHIKFGSSEINSATRGGFKVGVKGGADYGPTSVKGFWNGITPPVGGYTIYVDKASQGPSIHVANDDNQCIFFLKSFGSTGSTIGNVLDWADGQSNILVVTSELVIDDLPGGEGGNTGGPGWYFYSDEGALNAAPPTANGNAIFLDSATGGDETFDPNQGGTGLLLHFNVNDSAGTSYSSQFSDASQQFSTVTITQGSNVAEYFNGSGFGMSVINFSGSDVFIIDTTNCLQTQTAASAFNQNDVITLSFGGGGGEQYRYISQYDDSNNPNLDSTACTSPNGLTNVTFDTGDLGSAGYIYADNLNTVSGGVYWISDTTSGKVRAASYSGNGVNMSLYGSYTTPC